MPFNGVKPGLITDLDYSFDKKIRLGYEKQNKTLNVEDFSNWVDSTIQEFEYLSRKRPKKCNSESHFHIGDEIYLDLISRSYGTYKGRIMF